jgi:integrase/recombinase XerD
MDASSRVSPLRQRIIDDMRMRKLSEKTQGHYLRWVQRFAAYLGRSPDTCAPQILDLGRTDPLAGFAPSCGMIAA